MEAMKGVLKMKALKIIMVLLLLGVGACASYNQQRGTAAGAAIGAGSGAIIGNQFGKGGRDRGALIGAVTGGMAGLLYGQREDALGGQGHGSRNNVIQRGGGDDFRNPYRAPSPSYCRGQWVWDSGSGYWICQ